MDASEKLLSLSEHMVLEPAEDATCSFVSDAAFSSQPDQSQGKRLPGLSQAFLPGGSKITLLKTLQTSACERNCYYCPFRAGRDFHREKLQPDELATSFMGIYKAGIAQGLFLSSGITGGGVKSQDKILSTIEILRNKLGFKGYVHLKIMPGADRDQVYQAMRLANRVSINLEAPNTNRLGQLAPRKSFLEELIEPLKWIEEIRRSQPAYLGWNHRWPSSTTQFVVGAVGESDLELLQTTAYLNRNVGLARAYFSAFNPVSDTPFETLTPESPIRQQRLYQASFLLRDYGYTVNELPFGSNGRLPLSLDPKLAWALDNLQDNPIEINKADPSQLLRLPGIGPKSVELILKARLKGRLRNYDDLRTIGINPARSIPFMLVDGRKSPQQLNLF